MMSMTKGSCLVLEVTFTTSVGAGVLGRPMALQQIDQGPGT